MDGEQWAYSDRDERGNPGYRCRVGARNERDADLLVRMFVGIP